jgi:hypothetical protein
MHIHIYQALSALFYFAEIEINYLTNSTAATNAKNLFIYFFHINLIRFVEFFIFIIIPHSGIAIIAMHL